MSGEKEKEGIIVKKIGDLVEFKCERCNSTLKTSKLAVKCPCCNDFWYVFCNYCGEELHNFNQRIDGDCGCSRNDYYNDKMLEKKSELHDNNYEMADAIRKKRMNYILNKREQHMYDFFISIKDAIGDDHNRILGILSEVEDPEKFQKMRDNFHDLYEKTHSAYNKRKYTINPNDNLNPEEYIKCERK